MFLFFSLPSLYPCSNTEPGTFTRFVICFFVLLFLSISSAALSRECSYAFFFRLSIRKATLSRVYSYAGGFLLSFFLRLYNSIESRVQLTRWFSFAASVQQHWTLSTVKRVVFFFCICTATLSPVYSYAGGFLLFPFCICTKNIESWVQLSGWFSIFAYVQQHGTVVFFFCICTITLSREYIQTGGFLFLHRCSNAESWVQLYGYWSVFPSASVQQQCNNVSRCSCTFWPWLLSRVFTLHVQQQWGVSTVMCEYSYACVFSSSFFLSFLLLYVSLY